MLYIVSADYDNSLSCIVLKLYNTDTDRIEYYYDTVFKPYFYAKEKQVFKGITKQELVDKYDALHDEQVKVYKVTVEGPEVIRYFNKKVENGDTQNLQIWENHIKFVMRYIYDNDIKMGMPYIRERGRLLLNIDKDAAKRVDEITNLVKPETYNKAICDQLAILLEYPAPEFKRASLDIEVLSEGNKIPSPSAANLPVICVCFTTNTGEKHAFVLIQGDKEFSCPDADVVEWFTDEAELLEAVFKFGNQYPFIITFNGDDFDLPYLMNRAVRLGIPVKDIPISIQNPKEKIVYWKDAIHIDLYKFFQIKSMQNYAFAQKYKNVTLDEVSKALLKEGKLKGAHEWVNDMTYEELLTYCLKDSELTLRLTTYSDNVVMNLILVLARLSYLPIEQVSRKPISQWIRSFIYYEHKKRNAIIPRTEDIAAMKGKTTTTALIKGKKYKGAIVVNPVAGFHFNVKVGDFASLYPSIIKNWNLGYASVNCGHGQLWQKLSNETKRLIYEKLYYTSIDEKEVVKCQQIKPELENLMKNIERELPNIKEITIGKIKPILINKTENDINFQCKIQNTENCIENEQKSENKNGKNGTQKDSNYITGNGIENAISKSNSSSLPSKETNVKFVATQISDALKSTILMDEGREKQDNFVSFLNDMIGKNFNSFVQIVTELNIMSSCGTNKFADMKHWICLKNRAVESQLIGTLKDLRVKWYKKKAKEKDNPLKPWYSVAEQSIKVICNASYGVFGDEDFVLYCPPMPEYVTGIGRWIITQTIKHAQEMGLNVIAGDTDSVFFKNPAPEVLDALLAWAKKEFDIDFELDKDYRYVCLSGRKKNYFGVLRDGSVDVKGLTGKKKHTPQIIKTPFEETKKILAQIQVEADTQNGKTAILKLVKGTYTKIKTRNFGDMEAVSFHVTASRNIEDYKTSNPQHIKAAKQLRAAGYDIGEGSDISFVKVTSKERVKPTKLAKPEDIDVSKYIEFLRATFIQILEPLGLSWERDVLGCVVLDSFCPKKEEST